jgi:hypothetical protein
MYAVFVEKDGAFLQKGRTFLLEARHFGTKFWQKTGHFGKKMDILVGYLLGKLVKFKSF